MNWLRACLMTLALAALTACAAPTEVPPPSDTSVKTDTAAQTAPSGKVDYACTTDADCTVKDVGNCCGYYPACVNVGSPTFPEQVKAACAESGASGICGFPSISGCQCVEGRCKDVLGPAAVIGTDK